MSHYTWIFSTRISNLGHRLGFLSIQVGFHSQRWIVSKVFTEGIFFFPYVCICYYFHGDCHVQTLQILEPNSRSSLHALQVFLSADMISLDRRIKVRQTSLSAYLVDKHNSDPSELFLANNHGPRKMKRFVQTPPLLRIVASLVKGYFLPHFKLLCMVRFPVQ